MNTTKRFADKLFGLGFRLAFKLYRRMDAKAASQARPDGALDWLAPRVVTTWGEVMSGADHRQQADHTIR
jgi:hypothetical protein